MAKGAALGVLGIEGGLFWRHRLSVRRGTDSVSPLTWAGTLHVLAWIAGLVAIVVAGRALVPGLGVGWYAISLVIMVLVAIVWDRRAARNTEFEVGAGATEMNDDV
ncbi:MAG: hypothetical protein ABWZ99_14610 [Ilumatobacteraceae bacterium]